MTFEPGARVWRENKIGSVVYIDGDYARVCWTNGTWTWEDMRLLKPVRIR